MASSCFRRGPSFAPTDPSLLSLSEGATLGWPVLLRSWPGERGNGPGGQQPSLRRSVNPPGAKGWVAPGHRAGSGSGQQGNSDTYWLRGHRFRAVGAALGWGADGHGLGRPKESKPKAGPAGLGLACPRKSKASASRDP